MWQLHTKIPLRNVLSIALLCHSTRVFSRNPIKQRNPPKSTQPQPATLLENGQRASRIDQSEPTISPPKQPRKQKVPKSTNQIIAERLATNQIAENIVYELGEPSMLQSYNDPDLIWKQGLLNRAYYNL